jgi:large subunit ribosomal protein L13
MPNITPMETKTYTIDATNKKVGRIASEAATYLMGKNRTDFVRNKAPKVKVAIINASKADIDGKKLTAKNYVTYTGFPGGLNSLTMKQVIEKKGYGEVFKNAIYGMLPQNKLKTAMMKNLIVTE